ncbi:MAG: flagellar hook-associated protein FlgK [Deltaproteobacteria bacterium]|jgi:flagellar hook-associated protein 1 FlgK|nr:flagellar hook-associated protein FlgK [Deltaproteobacteria bacterium]
MAASINSLLTMGAGALFASQAAISVAGNNISNVNTVGYSRQSVLLKTNTSLDCNPGQIGQGVDAEQVLRAYDKFIERSLLTQLGAAAKYDNAYYALKNIENLFNESSVDGIGATLTAMFGSWNDLAQTAGSLAAREALLSASQSLNSLIRNADYTLEDMQAELDSLIREEVNNANTLITEIAELNRQINIHTIAGSNNANALLDERDQKVRELAEIIDIRIQDNGAGDYYVTTGAGHLLVQQDMSYSLGIRGPQAENNLTGNSPYKASSGSGTIGFSGADTKEYTIEIVTGGAVDGGAQFKVSLDGGNTWLTDDFGGVRLFEANSGNFSIKAGELELWFDAGASLAQGDKFIISPKNDIYWNSPTSGPINISSQFYADGTENSLRITGGALGGYLMARDLMIGEYREQLEGLAQSLIWEVNRIHSQGAGLTAMTGALGEYRVGRTDQPLGGDTADFAWAAYLTEGNLSFSIYNADTGESLIPYPGMEALFSSGNFDPAAMSLEDVRDAFNNASFTDADGNTAHPFTASIVDGRLQIAANGNYTFTVASDSTGLMAGLGINTYFTGTDASSIAVRDELVSNPNLVNAGSVNGAGEVNKGDNAVASAIAGLLQKNLTIPGMGGRSVNQSLLDYYAALVTRVGSDTLHVKDSATREVTVAQTLSDRREEIVGVSLDEELTNLIKFQSSYQAAAKLITTAEEMLQIILGMKQ